ncbi:DUF4118 domain-containing protein [Acidisoma sp. 7E03]
MGVRDEDRPDPEALLAALAREERAHGHLKIFLGAAPGVGKTFEMLAQARRRRAEGRDVLAGLIETHGRAETEAEIGDLPVLPRRRIPYRGQMLEELDLDAALARRPGLLLVDELAHTNAHGSRHAKRWEDVAELLDAGIDVWTTLNVQHLESLNDDIARITGIRPAETLPDRVLEMADEIEVIDVPPGELRARLQQGKIYRADNAARALNGFFREGNLAALREIALRRAAAHVDSDVQDWMRRTGVTGPWPNAERVLALVGADAAAEAVVRQAKRLADGLNAPWIALHVERPGPDTGSGLAARAPLALAAQLGAKTEVAVAGGAEPVAVILSRAQALNATHLVLGRLKAPWWRRVLGRRFADRLLREAGGFVLHLVPPPDQATAPRLPVLRPARPRWFAYAGTTATVGLVTGFGHLLRRDLPIEAADMVYLAIVLGCATGWGLAAGLLAAGLSVVCWDFFFIQPFYTVTIDSPRDILTGVVFGIVAVLAGTLAGRLRREERAAAARIDGLRRIGEFSRRLGEPTTEPELLAEIARQAAGFGAAAVVLTGAGEDLTLRNAHPPEAGAGFDEGAWAAARWAWTRGEPTGQGTTTLPAASWRFLPLGTLRGRLAVVGVQSDQPLDEPRLQALEALMDQAAVALERVRLALEAARATAMEETQRLRAALLASLGHDLRTPLASIQGAASTLRSLGGQLDPETARDLLASIEEDVGRMTRFLASIGELTRLESGEIRPNLVPVALLDVVEAAVGRLAAAHLVGLHVPPELRVMADATLLEQALFNVLENAFRYAPEGSLVRVTATETQGMIQLDIADEGVGIPAEELPRVFDSFFRASRGDRVAPGTGLGLAIARGLVEAMGGRISARSPRPDAARDGMPGTVIGIALRSAA